VLDQILLHLFNTIHDHSPHSRFLFPAFLSFRRVNVPRTIEIAASKMILSGGHAHSNASRSLQHAHIPGGGIFARAGDAHPVFSPLENNTAEPCIAHEVRPVFSNRSNAAGDAAKDAMRSAPAALGGGFAAGGARALHGDLLRLRLHLALRSRLGFPLCNFGHVFSPSLSSLVSICPVGLTHYRGAVSFAHNG
jgi:hypothetical protein